MGIDGLLQFLKPITHKEHLSSFKGQTIGIDIFPWLYKGCYNHIMSMDEQTLNLLHTKKCQISASTYMLEMINLLSYYGIKPYFVFDGRSLPMKQSTIKKRIQAREQNQLKAEEYFIENQEEGMRKCMARSLRIDQGVISEVMQILILKELTFIVAPYQADSQLAKLKKLEIIDTIITEDSDILVYGCNAIYKLNEDGQCDFIDIQCHLQTKIYSHYIQLFVNMNWQQRIAICVLSGCDYVKSIKGIGIKRAIKYYQQEKDINKILIALKNDKILGERMDQNYQSKVLNAISIFQYALTFNPNLCKLESYNNLLEVMDQSEYANIIGQIYPGYIQSQVYSGKTQSNILSPRIFPEVQIKEHTQVNILKLVDLQRKNILIKQNIEELKARIQEQQEENMLDAFAQITANDCKQKFKLPDMVSQTLYQMLVMNPPDFILSH